MTSRFLLPVAVAMGLAQPAAAQSLSPDALHELTGAAASDLATLIGPAAPSHDEIQAALDTMFEKLAVTRPDLTTKMPKTLRQAAHLAVSAEHPATRAAMNDLTREVLDEALGESGMDASADPTVAAWERADPCLRDSDKLHLTRSDEAAFARIAEKAGYESKFSPASFWDESEEVRGNRVLPARMNAWVAGLEAAWPKLSEAERTRAVEILDREDIPSSKLLTKVIGTGDVIGWLGGTRIKFSEAEEAASPELVSFMKDGAFAGPLYETLLARAAGGVQGGGGMGASATQLMRLNNWSAMTGEMSSWESYRYMTQGY